MSTNHFEVVCIGQALVDCILKNNQDDSFYSSVKMAESITLSPGGDAYNESVILTRLGHRVRIMCGLGRDMAGELLVGQLQENDVDTEAIVYSDTAQTPVAALFVASDGSRRSVNSPANRVPFFKLDQPDFLGVKVVSLASLFRAPFDSPDTILAVCRAAHAAGAIITADTKLAYGGELSLADVQAALPYIDYLFPNETEAEHYTGKQDLAEMADVLLDYGVKNVMIKTGPQGCFFKNRQESFALPAYRLPVCDTTGAGDNFAAGFISSLLHGRDVRTAAAYATACAALCVGSVGAVSGVQNHDQVTELMRKHQLPDPL